MNLKQLESAQKIYDQIREVDNRITELNAFAQQVAKGGQAHFNMKVDIPNLEKAPNVLDADGSLKTGESYSDFRNRSLEDMMRAMASPRFMFEIPNPEKAPNVLGIQGNVSETTAFKIVNFILQDLTDQRERLLNKMKNLGIQISQ